MAEGITVQATAGEKDPKAQRHQEAVDKFLGTARTRFQTIVTAESQLREDMQDDLEFRAGGENQWDEGTLTERQDDDRPCLTINRLPQFIRQVTNAQRQSNLAVKVTGVDDHADPNTADVIQGLIRHIEQQSDAQVAYATGAEHQATMGRGYWRIVTEYDGPKSFVQNIRIRRVRNSFTVFMDPSAQEADGSDCRYAFVVEDMPKPEFEARFGADALKDVQDWASSVELGVSQDWLPEGRIKVAEYWYIDTKRTPIHLIEWPKTKQREVVTPEELQQIPEAIKADQGEPVIVATRTTELKTVKFALITGAGIIEGNEDLTAGREWAGQWIPIVPVIGDEIDINGRLDLRGMVRDAKDPQRLYNYQNSTLAETLAQVPRSQWVGYEGQFEGHEATWLQAHKKAFPYLQVRPIGLDSGHVAPLPQRISASADIGAIMTAITQSDQDLKATMGLYEPSLGVRQSGGQSGKAIEALKKQGEQANSNFLDNMSRAIRFTGRILVDLIPKIYDVPRVLRIIGADEVEQTVLVFSTGEAPAELPEGVKTMANVGVGKYDVAVSAGPSLETKRQEAFLALSSFVQAYPDAFPVIGDLLMGSLDWPGAKAAAERLKRAVPPQFLDDEDGGEPIPPKVAAQMQQLVQQLEATGLELAEAKKLIDAKQLELQGKAQIEREKASASAAEKAMEIRLQAQADAMLKTLEAKLELVARRFEQAHERAMMAQGRADDRVDTAFGREADREEREHDRTEGRKDATVEAARDRETQGGPVDLTVAH